jgi:hypothetical protein
LRRLACDEDGAAYTLSYVMVIPIYALLICLIIETCLMLTAKLGTVYAAYAAVRSASVWSTATTWENAQKKAKKSAIHAMVPFASGTQSIAQTAPLPGDVDNVGDAALDSAAFLAEYQLFAEKPVATQYLTTKYAFALRHVKVQIDGPPATGDAEITAKVTYEFPFNVPGIGMLLGRRGGDGGYYFDLTSEATIPNEGPRGALKNIGIGYGTLE